MTRPTVYLFDLDGTLVTTGGAGRRALMRAFEDVAGPADALGFSFAGMTDRGIVREGLVRAKLEANDATIDQVLEAYLALLGEEVARAESYAVYPGVVSTLDALTKLPNVAVGLGTGNVEAGARIKLERSKLNRYFAFGGFGCDAEERGELIRIGADRGAARLGQAREGCRVIVIGDTPRDVAAARAIGADCVAVSTGGATREELSACGADWVFDRLDLADAAAALGL